MINFQQEKQNILSLMEYIAEIPSREERKRKLKPLKSILELINLAITAQGFQELKMNIEFGLDNQEQKTLILTDEEKGIRLFYIINKHTHKIYKHAKNIKKTETKMEEKTQQEAIA
jgi:hypothetical protein